MGCTVPKNTLPYPLTISEEGLGTLNFDTSFEQINTSLIGFDFQKLSRISAEQNCIIVQIKRGGKTIAQIFSDPSGKKIVTIAILSPLIKNKSNIGLGDPLPLNKNLICNDNRCHSEMEPSLHYRIDPSSRIIREITFSRL